MLRWSLVVLCSSLAASVASAETFTVASYNIENFTQHFEGHREQIDARKNPLPDPEAEKKRSEQIRERNSQDMEEQWEISETISDPAFTPDILMIQEGCLQGDLEYFNRRWLKNAYETVLVLPTNVYPDHPQTLAVMMKPGFKILEKKDQYYLESDPVPNSRGNRLFARGPSFLKVQTPGGYVFWVGNTHQKSKAIRMPQADAAANPTTGQADPREEGNFDPDNRREESPDRKTLRAKLEKDACEWRLREATRTHQIVREIEKLGPTDVLLVGDMNDDLGKDKTEEILGQDGLDTLIGPPNDRLHLMTQQLVDTKQQSYGGYWNPKYRSLIDHALATDTMATHIVDVHLFKGSLAKVASDHYPLLLKIDSTATTGLPPEKPATPAAGAAMP